MSRFIPIMVTIVAAFFVAVTATSADAKGFYVAGFGGANWEDVSYDNGWISVKDSTGYVIGGALGTTIDAVPGLRAEGELSFRSNGLDILICDDPLSATDRTWALVGNILYDFQTPNWPVHPYVMVGAGYGSRTATLDSYGYELSNQGFVVQAGGGLNTQLAEGVIVGVEYRIFDAPNLQAWDVDNDGINQSVLVKASFSFN